MDLDHLKTIPLFSSLSDKALSTVAVFASETSVSSGKLLVHEGDYSYDLIVIDTGTADVIKGGEVIGTLGPGDVFGETGVLGKSPRNATIVASSPMRLVRLTSWEVKRLPQDVRDRMAELVESRKG